MVGEDIFSRICLNDDSEGDSVDGYVRNARRRSLYCR